MTGRVLFMALAIGAVPPATPIRPGYWEATDRVLAPIESTKVERRCIAARDVTKFMSCYINHHYSCSCPDQSYTDGKISFSGLCTDAKGRRVGITGRGTYTETTLHMTAEVTFKLAGLPISGRASTDARLIADACPALPTAPGATPREAAGPR
jgi:hypothetical protein